MSRAPDRHPLGARQSIAAGMLSVFVIAMVAVPAQAQESTATQRSEDGAEHVENALVARLALPADALDEVASSVELVAALREHLALDLSMPLEEPLQVTLHGLAGQPSGDAGPAYRFGWSFLGIRYRGPGTLENHPYALAVRESHGTDFPPDGDAWEEFDDDDEWSEGAAWSRLVEALDAGLRQSAASFTGSTEDGHVALGVAGVHLREFRMADRADSAWADFGSCCDGFEGRALLQLRPDVSYPSAMRGGTGGDPAARLNVLVIELAPGPGAGADSSTAGASLSPADTEAVGMTQTLQSACGAPQLQTSGTPGTAGVVIDGEQHSAEAVVAVDGDTNRLVRLGGEADGGFCLILMGRGGPTAPGTFEVRKLSMEAMQGGSDATDPWFAAALGTGSDGRSLVVVEGGSVKISALEPTVIGRFELTGWRSDGQTRGATVAITGTFDAAQAEP